MIVLPARPIVRTYVARSAKLWIVARALMSMQVLFAAQDPSFAIGQVTDPLFGTGVMVVVVAIATALGVIETHRRHEWALLGNLGVGTRDVMALLVLPPAMGEVLMHVVYAMVRLPA